MKKRLEKATSGAWIFVERLLREEAVTVFYDPLAATFDDTGHSGHEQRKRLDERFDAVGYWEGGAPDQQDCFQ